VASGKGRLGGVLLSNGTSLLTWSDNRADGNGVYAQNVNFDGTLGNVTGVATPPSSMPLTYELQQNYPNPFNPGTTITYSIPARTTVRLTMYDLLGREVAVLVQGEKPAGTYSEYFDGSHLSSGIYFYTLSAGSFSATRKLMLIK
jgi:hypothetical protein